MRAAVLHGAGDVRIETVPDPSAPGPGEVVLEVLRAGICGSDAAEFSRGPVVTPLQTPNPRSGHHGPVILGHEFVGRVVEVGSGVTGLQVGRRVVPGAGVWCGSCAWCLQGRPNLCERYFTLGLQADGGMAEFVAAPARICVEVPAELTDDSAAMTQPFGVALHALDRARLTADDTVWINGAGGIGGFLVAGAAARGCGTIIASDVSDERLDLARQLGATHVLNATAGDVAAAVTEITGGGAHVAVEASGAPGTLGTVITATRRGGRVLLVGLPKQPPTVDTADIALRELDVIGTVAHVCDRNIPQALDILTTTPSLQAAADRVIALDHLVDDGLLPLCEGRVTGKVLVDISR
ncbi:zinc-dependent alcohol dehydrogenase [Mycolicibacterium mengxianglii]|uniref:zinc-dependent alcohol dehydrogenase n=1 Tax=Mycolicibacterium mengxianglii TaxID=2736649 RepID=UPI0018EEFD23|nr:zinc-binding dehydrogenase [Mycolicibacterium mengxianglii]